MADNKTNTKHKRYGQDSELKACPKCGKEIPSRWDHHKECGWKETHKEHEETDFIGKSKIIIFTSPTCPHCHSAVDLAKEIEKMREDVKVTEISTATKSGHNKAEQMGVMAVPTIFVRGPGYPQNIGFRGTPSKNALLKAIDISLGKAEWKEEKGLLKSMLDKLPIKIKW